MSRSALPSPEFPLQPAPNERRRADRRAELPNALAACSAIISQHFRGELSEQAMHEAVRRFAVHMHAVEVPPERALAHLKEAILVVPEVAVRPAMERAELLRVLVERAIRSYYSTSTTDVM